MSLSALGDDPRKIKRNGVIRRSRCIKVLSARNTHNTPEIYSVSFLPAAIPLVIFSLNITFRDIFSSDVWYNYSRK